MRIEDYQKWLSAQFLDEPVEEEEATAVDEAPAEAEVHAEPMQWAPAPAPEPPPAPAPPAARAWRPPSPPAEPPQVAEALDTSQPGPAAYISRPAAPPRTHAPAPADEAAMAPPADASPVAPPAAPPRAFDTEPVATRPPQVIDASEEVAPPIDRFFRLRRPAPAPEQLSLEDVAPTAPAEEAAPPVSFVAPPAVEPPPTIETEDAVPEEAEVPRVVAAETEAEREPEPERAEAEAVAAPPPERPAWVEPEEPIEAPPAAAAPAAEPEPPAKPQAPVRRARHARNVRPTEVVPEMDARTLWSLVPRHIQTLVAMDADEVTQNSYKRAFRESRLDLVQRLLDPTLSLEETARLLNVCPTTVRRYTNRGLLTHQRTSGDQRRFKLSDVLAFLEAQQRARE